jgi:hypothetical protein
MTEKGRVRKGLEMKGGRQERNGIGDREKKKKRRETVRLRNSESKREWQEEGKRENGTGKQVNQPFYISSDR